jgi:hypothetical protein
VACQDFYIPDRIDAEKFRATRIAQEQAAVFMKSCAGGHPSGSSSIYENFDRSVAINAINVSLFGLGRVVCFREYPEIAKV